MEPEENQRAIGEHACVFKNQPLTGDGGQHGEIHRIPHITIEAGDHQMARWKNRRRCTEPFHGKSGERIEQREQTRGQQRAAGQPKRNPPDPAI